MGHTFASILGKVGPKCRKCKGKIASSILIPFPITHRFETDSFNASVYENKSRNYLNVEFDLQSAKSETKPNIKDVVNKKQLQSSRYAKE